MTEAQMLTKLKQLRDQYAIDSDTQDPATWDAVTDQYWKDECDAWEDHLGHPVTKPRPRPR